MPKPSGPILIIDDNDDMLTMLSIILRGKGYKVTARQKFTAMEKEIAALAPRMILIDKNLGWADGVEICRLIRKIPSLDNPIIIIFSAYSLSAEECTQAGATGIFEKPFGMADFLDKIESYLRV